VDVRRRFPAGAAQRALSPSGEAERQFRQLFDAHYRLVVAYARRRGRTLPAAEDIAAETFLVAWRRVGEILPPPDSVPWLLAVARRVMANDRRTDIRRDKLLAGFAQLRPTTDPSTAHTIATTGHHKVVLDALAQLPAAHVEILQLAAWEQLTHSQIAVVLGCSTNAVAIRLHRARLALNAQLMKK
jgi:RNA polymerase sigma-70 factor (ECF subfamily)